MDTPFGELQLPQLYEAQYRWDRARFRGPLSYFGKKGGLALGFLPQSNEPLGSALLSVLPESSPFLCIRNIDPPPLDAAFPIPTDFFGYLARFHLAPIPEQVEFSHTSQPHSSSELRAAELRKVLKETQIQKFLVFRSDPFANFPYFYANSPIPQLENSLRIASSHYFEKGQLLRTSHTDRISDLTYRYFSVSKIDPRASAEAMGLFIPSQLGIETVTLELPMFHWGNCPAESKSQLIQVHQQIWQNRMSIKDRISLINSVSRAFPFRIPMIPASIAAEIQLSAIRSWT